MKKIFTLVALAAMAMTANAEFVLTGVNIGCTGTVKAWDWMQQATNDSESHQDETTGEWIIDKEATYDYKDASAYDYIVVQFEENAVGAHFICVDNTWAKKISTDFVAKADYVAVDLATSEVGTFKDNIACFVMQPFADGNLKISKISYMTKAEYDAFAAEKAKVEKTDDLALPGTKGTIEMEEGEGAAGWYSPGWIGKTSLNTLYKTLVFEVASAKAPYNLKVQGSEDGSTWDDNGFATYAVAAHSEPAVIAVPVEGIHVNLGQYAFQNNNVDGEPYANQKGEMVSDYLANTVVVTRVYLTSKVVESNYPVYSAGVEEIVAEAAASKKAVKVAKDGKIVIVKGNAEFNVAGQLVK